MPDPTTTSADRHSPLRGGSRTLAIVGGIRLRAHWTFLLLLGFVLFNGLIAGGIGNAVAGVVFILLLFASVVAHEFGHALMARRYGIGTRDILLLPIGGVARIDAMPDEPRQELAIALAGPIVSALIVAGLALVLGGVPMPVATVEDGGLRNWLTQLMWANAVIFVFNLLPAFPMDGGRVLRAALTGPLGHARATDLASKIGQGAALLFGIFALLSFQPILLLVAIFIFFAASAERQMEVMRRAGGAQPITATMVRRFETLPADIELEEAAKAFVASNQDEIPLVDPGGRPTGFLILSRVLKKMAGKGEHAAASLAAIRPVAVVSADASAQEVARLVVEEGGPVAVVDEEGHLCGYQSLTNLAEVAAVEEAKMSGGSSDS